MTAPPRFPVVSLDLWGTVLTFGDRAAAAAWRLAEFQRVLTAFGHQLPAEHKVAATIRDLGERQARLQRHAGAQPTPGEQVDAILAALGVPADDDLQQVLITVHTHANLRACPEPTSGVTAVLDRLRAAGHTLVLSSNTLTCPGAVTRRILDDHDLTHRFDRLCFSDELGVAKPHPGFFAAVTTTAGVRPDKVLHVGDDWRTDVCGAAAAGWQPVWFNPTGKPRPRHAGDTAVLAELADLTALPQLAAHGARRSLVPAACVDPAPVTAAGPR